MRFSLLAVLLLAVGCGDSPKASASAPVPVVTEHIGQGVVRTVEYWEEGEAGHRYGRSRVVIETADHQVRQFDRLCENRIAAWQGLEFKDMTFQYNADWQCTHIIEFQR